MGKDFLDGDFSFKNWFKIMWQNTYIQLFIVGFGVTVYELCIFNQVIDCVNENFDAGGTFGGIATIIGVCICPIMAIVIAYKGFYQYWKDLKNGISR